MLARIAFIFCLLSSAVCGQSVGDSLLLILVKKSAVRSLLSPSFEAPRVGVLNDSDQGLKWNGLCFGLTVEHPSTAALWREYNRNVVFASGFTFRQYFTFDLQLGVPVYRPAGQARRTYFLGSIFLKLF